MWVFMTNAAVSIVADPETDENLLVRGRVKGDVERALRAVAPNVRATRTPGRDYLWRASVPRRIVAEALRIAAEQIAYGNFKGSLPHTADGERRHHWYLDVWQAGMTAQRQHPANGNRPATRQRRFAYDDEPDAFGLGRHFGHNRK